MRWICHRYWRSSRCRIDRRRLRVQRLGQTELSQDISDLRVSVSGLSLPGTIVTDRYGRRFTNEEYRLHTLYYELAVCDSHKLSYPRVPSWWFFDERRRLKRAITATYFSPTGPSEEVPWSDDNLAEIEKG